MKRTRLRTYRAMARQSLKVRKAEPDFRAVYRLVDQRSEGRCETVWVWGETHTRCQNRAQEHHHLLKPRRQHHQPDLVLAVCRRCHDIMAYPFKRGRLVWLFPNGGGMREFEIRYASDKWAART